MAIMRKAWAPVNPRSLRHTSVHIDANQAAMRKICVFWVQLSG